MLYGTYLPHLGPLARGDVLSHIRTAAQTAEGLGFDSVWVGDHIVIPNHIESEYPYDPGGSFPIGPQDPVLEPLTVLSYVAGCTSKVRLGTAVFVLPYCHAVVTAKTIATLDVLSGGRLIFGAGVGWLSEEFTVLNAPFNKRGTLSNETLAAMKELWTSENPNFADQFYSFSEVGAEPRPVQKPHPPIWIGGHTNAALRRVVEQGDGWVALVFSPQDFAQSLDRLREQADEAGRDLTSITLCISPLGASRWRPSLTTSLAMRNWGQHTSTSPS